MISLGGPSRTNQKIRRLFGTSQKFRFSEILFGVIKGGADEAEDTHFACRASVGPRRHHVENSFCAFLISTEIEYYVHIPPVVIFHVDRTCLLLFLMNNLVKWKFSQSGRLWERLS